jgi:cytosine/adenosine deaminase-related metal-dependent hydrolase
VTTTPAPSLLIRNGHLLTMDRILGEIPDADILIEDGLITAVGSDLQASDDAEVIDARDHIVIPGFVDTHRHMWQTQLRGEMTDATLVDYTAIIRGAYSACYEPEDVYIGILAGYLDALNAGTTSLIDHCHIMNSAEHTDAAIRAFRNSGAGGVFCYGLFPNPERGKPDDLSRVIDPPARLWDEARRIRTTQFSPENRDRIRWSVALSELEFFPLKYSMRELNFARELDAHKISAHVGLGEASAHTRWVKRLYDAGELADDLLMVHGWSLTTEELEHMAETGATLSVTPDTELQMGMGFPALQRFTAVGGRPGIGIDIVSNQSSDMFSQMRLGLQSLRGLHNERLAARGLFPATLDLTTAQILHHATIDGAHALGLEDEIGSISVGKRGDLVFIRKNDINIAPATNATAAVVHYANVGNIDTVVAGGIIRKRNGQLVGHNVPEIVDELLESTGRVLSRAKEFDRDERKKQISLIFPTNRRASLEQRFSATVFRSPRAKRLHDPLMRLVLSRTKTTNHPNSS